MTPSIVRFRAKNPVPRLRNQQPMLFTWSQVEESMVASGLPVELWRLFFERKEYRRRSVSS